MLCLTDGFSNINQVRNPTGEGHHGHGSEQHLCITDTRNSRGSKESKLVQEQPIKGEKLHTCYVMVINYYSHWGLISEVSINSTK